MSPPVPPPAQPFPHAAHALLASPEPPVLHNGVPVAAIIAAQTAATAAFNALRWDDVPAAVADLRQALALLGA